VQRAGRGAHHLVVGFRAGILVTPAVRAFTAEHSEVTVELERLEWDEQEQAILSGRIDIAYVRQPINERSLRLIPLFAERRLAALPAGHRLSQRATLSTAELANEPHLRYLDPAPLRGVRGPQRPLRSVEEKLEHVAAGHGIIVLPLSATQYYGRPDIVYVPVVDAEPDQVYLACEATRRSKLIADFIRLAKSLHADDQAPTTVRPPEDASFQ
jgi:DNA-binding transcriptional LysR family regulator